jgi:hypothetical protein
MLGGVDGSPKKYAVELGVRKILISLVISLLLTPAPAQASQSVPYKKQKAGQFCKVADTNKTVKLPDGAKLICKKDGSRARWKNK